MPDPALPAPPAPAAHLAALHEAIAAQRGWSAGAMQVSAALADIARQQARTTEAARGAGNEPIVA